MAHSGRQLNAEYKEKLISRIVLRYCRKWFLPYPLRMAYITKLVTLKKLGVGMTDRIGRNYRSIIGFNGGLIVLGVGSIITPATSALLHNASTLAITLKSMGNLL